MKWFKHDSAASQDVKLQKLMLRYGLEGYGLYWYCIEMIVSNIEIHNLTFELEHDAEILAHNTRINIDVLQGMIEYMVELGLFESSQGTITCLKIAKRLDQSMTSNQKMREKIKHINDLMPDRIMIGSCQNHDGVMQEEKRREEKRIDKGAKARFVPPTEAEVEEYAMKNGWKINAEKFCSFYGSKGWVVGKSKMKSWKHAVTNSREWTEKKGNTEYTDEESRLGKAI